MEEIIAKLQDLNKADVMWTYRLTITEYGIIVLNGYGPDGGQKHIPCYTVQELREEMYRIILNCKR